MKTQQHPASKPKPTPQVVVNGNFTPAQTRCIAMAFSGQPSNKAQANAEGVNVDAIVKRWERIYDKTGLLWGNRSRANCMAKLCRDGLVQFMCLVLVCLPLISLINDNDIDAAKHQKRITRRISRKTRTKSGGKNSSGYDFDNIIDFEQKLAQRSNQTWLQAS